ncbi:hypothetical protein AB6A40_003867 [Gnathostoma spinigerum]|uniref:Secreted protein n=1 Tax=Gnathostoma spinigerum TaxID=75299 RepID=A0ABD6EJK8_9BILA
MIQKLTGALIFTICSLYFCDCGSLNQRVAVADNDRQLLDLVYRTGVTFANSKLPYSEPQWWIPLPAQTFHATRIRVYDSEKKKYYSTYNIMLMSAKSNCDRKNVPLSAIRRRCVVTQPIRQSQVCQIMIAWFDGDWETTEVEGICDIRTFSQMATQKKDFDRNPSVNLEETNP